MMVIVIGWLVLLSTPYLAQFVSVLGVDRGWVEIASTLVLTIGFPVSLGVSISRYRLYDIGRLVSRTVSYALVLGLLAVVVLGLVTLLATFLPSDDPLVVAVSTLAAAALFNPVRKRVQSVIDRRFNRSRYDAQRVIGSFAATLPDQVDPDEVVDGWVEVVGDTMQPSAVGFWVKD
jgi:O-antigen/teichoic acid export membrane protein